MNQVSNCWGCYDVKFNYISQFFTAQHYASAVYAVIVCPSVCLFIRMSQLTSQSLTKMAKSRITQTMLAYSGHTMRKHGSCLEKEIMQATIPNAGQ